MGRGVYLMGFIPCRCQSGLVHLRLWIDEVLRPHRLTRCHRDLLARRLRVPVAVRRHRLADRVRTCCRQLHGDLPASTGRCRAVVLRGGWLHRNARPAARRSAGARGALSSRSTRDGPHDRGQPRSLHGRAVGRAARKMSHMLENHRVEGTAVHLFVRPTGKVAGKTRAFIYCGELEFERWEGDKPITVWWQLRNPIPISA